MNSDDRYEIKNKNFHPHFKDSKVEYEFMAEFNFEALKAGRIAYFIVLFVWVGFSFFDMHLNDQARSSTLFFRLLVVTPFLLVMLGLLHSKYAVRLYQMISLFILFVIEISIPYVVKFYDFQELVRSMGYELPMNNADGKCIFIFIWLLVIFMGSLVARLNIVKSVLNGLLILFLCGVIVFNYQPSFIFVIIGIPFLVSTLLVVWIGTIHIQQYARQNFRTAKLLAHSMQESEDLLLNILPVQIANRLKNSPGTIADGFNHVSVLFADIVGFTKLSGHYKPDAIVKMLNRIFTRFDQISNQYGAEKIKTIGDAYMLAAGIPEVSTNHCETVAHCALDMIDAMASVSDPDGNPIQIRIGIHTGPAIAGIIGTHKFSYDIWGDTVNIASRMESHGTAGKILVTDQIAKVLENDFILMPHKEIEVKGKGKMETFWLTGHCQVSDQ